LDARPKAVRYSFSTWVPESIIALGDEAGYMIRAQPEAREIAENVQMVAVHYGNRR
jgi:hypothetical protein